MSGTGSARSSASTQARFRKPLTYPGPLWVGAQVVAFGADRVTFEHKLVSRTWDDVAAEGHAVVVCFDYRNGTKAPLPRRCANKSSVGEG